MKDDTISRHGTSAWLENMGYPNLARMVMDEKRFPSIQPEPLTDAEQQIFLVAMERERKVCEKVDNQFEYEPDEPPLVGVCDEIKRKVKKVLWT